MPGTPINPALSQSIAPADMVSLDKVSEIAIPDIARYQEQLLRMILHHDDRALRVLSLYVTVLGALVTALFALIQAQVLTAYFVIPIVAAALALAVGCAFAYRAGWTARIFLPGRKPDFWIWAIENEQTVQEAALAYTRQAADTIAHNERVADRAASHLGKAYFCGLAAPAIAAAALWLYYWS
jgi:hypothetical protein